MTNNLSPVYPIFFLHHGNMDRLWDVWTRKQQKQGKAYLPAGADAQPFTEEMFLFYIDANGKSVPPTRAEPVRLPGSSEAFVPVPLSRVTVLPENLMPAELSLISIEPPAPSDAEPVTI